MSTPPSRSSFNQALARFLAKPCTRRTALLAGLVASAGVVAGACGCSGTAPSSSASASASAGTGTTTQEGWILQEAGTLKVSAWLDYMPFEGESGFKTVGFAYELMEQVAAELGLELEYLSSKSQERALAAVTKTAKVDVAVSSLLPSMVQEAGALATNPYLELGVAVASNKKDEIGSIENLAGKKVGIVPSSPSEAWARANISGCTFVECEDYTFLYAQLQAENIDAAASNLEVAKYYLRMMLTSAEIIASEDTSSEKFVMALAPQNTALCDSINAALTSIKANGAYQTLYDSWFNETMYDSTTESRTPEQGAPGYSKGA